MKDFLLEVAAGILQALLAEGISKGIRVIRMKFLRGRPNEGK